MKRLFILVFLLFSCISEEQVEYNRASSWENQQELAKRMLSSKPLDYEEFYKVYCSRGSYNLDEHSVCLYLYTSILNNWKSYKSK